MLKKLVLAAVGLFAAASAYGQTVTVTAPLPDNNHDGRVVVSTQAAALGVPRGTVLTRCGQTLTYVGPSTPCPVAAPPAPPAPPPAPVNVQPVPLPAAPVIPAVLTTRTSTHSLSASAGSTGLIIQGEQGNVKYWVMNIYPAGPANNLTIRQSRMTCGSRTCIRESRDSSGGLLENLDLSDNAVDSENHFPAGILLDAVSSTPEVGVHNTIVRQVVAHNFRSTTPSGYPDADGFVENRGAHDNSFIDISAYDNTDGGLDTKGRNTTILRAYFARNRYGIRGWVSGHGQNITCDNNRTACVEIMKTGNYSFDGITVIGTLGSHGDVDMTNALAGAHASFAHCNRALTLSGSAAQRAMVTLDTSCGGH